MILLLNLHTKYKFMYNIGFSRVAEDSTNFSNSSYVKSEPKDLSILSNTMNTHSILDNYRKFKANEQYKFENTNKGFLALPNIFCSFFGIESNSNGHNQIYKCRCQCQKQSDNLCQLVMRWIQQQYYWKTDPQFHKILSHYNRKSIQPGERAEITERLDRVLEILGLQIQKQQRNITMQVLSNYWKHTVYYNKHRQLIGGSDIYIWVCLGIFYHIGFDDQDKNLQTKKAVVFWALDICMNRMEDLTIDAFKKHHSRIVKMFYHYYSKWTNKLERFSVSIVDISWEWLNEMMFGYMGIQNIGIFLDCFLKAGWPYMYKIILSFFEQRTNEINRNPKFQNQTIQRQQLLRLLINEKEEWPMVFCSALSFQAVQ